MHKKQIIFGMLVIILIAVVFTATRSKPSSTTSTTATSASAQTTIPKTDSFSKTTYSTTDPTSIWVVVNKQHALKPQNYVPANLVTPNVPLRVPGNESMQIRQPVATAMEAMFAAAKTAGVPMMLSSGYRSYSYQVGLYNGYVASDGKAAADTFSARPGSSEHQTGLAFDVEPLNQQCDVDQCFANLPAGKWVAAHAYEYGFLLRYPADKVAVTGYSYEPWHLRYIGKPLAAELHAKHIETLEEYFGITGGTVYAE